MKIEDLAVAVIEACEAEGVEHMLTGVFATSAYGIPRSTKDVDVVLNVGGKSLDMAYVERRCEAHGTLGQLHEALAGRPPLD